MGLNTVKEILCFNHETAFNDEIRDRAELVSRLVYTGVKQIDLLTSGIWPNDLFLLGAPSGSGKTSIMSEIAVNVARSGKYVDFFALEASKFEIHRRIKYMVYAKHLNDKHQIKMKFSDWLRFKCEDQCKLVASEADADLNAISKYLRIHYRSNQFEMNDFLKLYHYYAKDSSIMLFDHAQFLNFDEKSKTENSFIKDMTLQMYDLVNNVRVPIVLVSHVRKLDNEEIIPDIYDFHGSSELYKKATRVLLIKRHEYLQDYNAWTTVFRLAKNREEDPKALLSLYDNALKQYVDKIKWGYIKGDKFYEWTNKST